MVNILEKPVSLLVAVVGNVMLVIGIHGATTSDGWDELTRHGALILVGMVLASLAIRAGGAMFAFYAADLSGACGSLWTALTADDTTARVVGFVLFVVFASAALVARAGRLISWLLGRYVSSTTTGLATSPDWPTILAELERLRAQGLVTDEQMVQVQAARQSLSSAELPLPREEMLAQLDALRDQGLLTDEQLRIAKSFWGGNAPS